MSTDTTEPDLSAIPDALTADELAALAAAVEYDNAAGCWRFTGDIEAGRAAAERDRYVVTGKTADGRHHTVGLSGASDASFDTCDEFGYHPDETEAWRYALGSYFGPDAGAEYADDTPDGD